jgi:hypothetical protein
MFDPLKKEKLQLKQATINAELATKYTERQFKSATLKSKEFISSPTGIVTMFIAGSVRGVSSSKSSASTLISLLFKLF